MSLLDLSLGFWNQQVAKAGLWVPGFRVSKSASQILKPDDLAKEEFFEKCAKVSTWVFEIVEKYQGSVSAEHGVGMTKKPYLQYTRSAVEIDYMRAMKAVFDPQNIMNPGKVIDL